MRFALILSVVLWICPLISTAATPATESQPAAAASGPAATRPNSGLAVAPATRPASFPHRIWAANDFEARLPDYGWFGQPDTDNILRYPGNTTACSGRDPQPDHSALKTGCNPVPGPRMGKVNKLYLRYFGIGADVAKFQFYSLTVSDNSYIYASGLQQGRWAETVLDFTHDARRNGGQGGPFEEGERMDDLQIYYGKMADRGKCQILIDDVILFSDDPALPPEPEPFPQRVIFLAGFDSGIDGANRAKYWPGRFDIVDGEKAPAGSYWGVAKAVAAEEGQTPAVALELKPTRHVGANTKLRFRCWVQGSSTLRFTLHDASAGANRTETLAALPQGGWTTQYVTFSRDERTAAGQPFPAGSDIDSLTFTADSPDAVLYIDEVIIFDAAPPPPAATAPAH